MSGEMGRFINRDPIEYQDGMNLYAGWFVCNFLDPFGYRIYRKEEVGVRSGWHFIANHWVRSALNILDQEMENIKEHCKGKSLSEPTCRYINKLANNGKPRKCKGKISKEEKNIEEKSFMTGKEKYEGIYKSRVFNRVFKYTYRGSVEFEIMCKFTEIYDVCKCDKKEQWRELVEKKYDEVGKVIVLLMDGVLDTNLQVLPTVGENVFSHLTTKVGGALIETASKGAVIRKK
jgi:hypothetical protein